METWGLDMKLVARRHARPTGTVAVTLDRRGVAKYEIVRDVAWDHVEHAGKSRVRQLAPAAIVFGTLALREHRNRKALLRLFKLAPEALRVADLNLRAPFDRGAGVAFALKHAQLLKLNEDELARFVSGASKTRTTMEQGARKVAMRYKLSRICVTAGPRGAGLLWDGNWYWEDAKPVDVRDTVGSGDAFLAGLLSELLCPQSLPDRALSKACRLGEFVASRDGATPAYRVSRDGKVSDV
jgi:fructokinase